MNKDVTFKLCGNCGDKVFFFKLGSCYTPRGGKHNQEDLKASPGFESKRIAQQFQVYQLYFWINHLIYILISVADCNDSSSKKSETRPTPPTHLHTNTNTCAQLDCLCSSVVCVYARVPMYLYLSMHIVYACYLY